MLPGPLLWFLRELRVNAGLNPSRANVKDLYAFVSLADFCVDLFGKCNLLLQRQVEEVFAGALSLQRIGNTIRHIGVGVGLITIGITNGRRSFLPVKSPHPAI